MICLDQEDDHSCLEEMKFCLYQSLNAINEPLRSH